MLRCALFGLLLAAALAQNDCGKPCDVMLVVDRSGSIKKFAKGGATGGEVEADFVKKLIGDLDNHYKDLKIGLVSYNKKVYNNLATMTMDPAGLINKVDSMPGVGGVTHTFKGINSAITYMKKGQRSTVQCKRMYVITDGQTYPKSYAKSTQNSAKAARDAGYEVFAIGVGNGIKGNAAAEAEMKGIASDPDSKYFVEADDFDKVFDILHKKDVCLPAIEPCVGLPSVHGGSGTWTCTKEYKTGHFNHTSQCTLQCPSGSTTPGNGQANCNNGTWADVNDDKCPSSACTGTPAAVTGGSWSCPTPMNHGDICNLTCQFGLQSGDGIAQCTSGQLVNTVKDVCDSSACPTLRWNFGGSTYTFTKKKASWTQSAQMAMEMGGYLASITTAAEQTMITNKFKTEPTIKNHEYWFGLHAPSTQWVWSSGSPFSYTNWGNSPPPASGPSNHYGMLNEDFISSGDAVDLGKWSAEDNGIDPECGLVEIPGPVRCDCSTKPDPANPSQCAPTECSTQIAGNVWSFVMCKFDFPAEFGTWTETSPNHFTSSGGKYSCAPAASKYAAAC